MLSTKSLNMRLVARIMGRIFFKESDLASTYFFSTTFSLDKTHCLNHLNLLKYEQIIR